MNVEQFNASVEALRNVCIQLGHAQRRLEDEQSNVRDLNDAAKQATEDLKKLAGGES